MLGALLLWGLASALVAGCGKASPAKSTAEAPPAAATAKVPTAEHPSVEAVRDTVEAILRRAVSPADTAIHFSREKVEFKYWYAQATAPGWAPAYGYQADGPDGGDMGFVIGQVLCLVEAHWDGGDDTDSTYVPVSGCEVTVTCVPRRDDDILPR